MKATPVDRRRLVLGATLLVAGLVLAAPPPAAAQIDFCSVKSCAFVICVQSGEPPRTYCFAAWAGCYSTDRCAGCCICPVQGGTCVPTSDALTNDPHPTDEALIAEGRLVCHELIRERLKVERGVRLFDDESSSAAITAPGRVRVTGRAYPGGVPASNDDSFAPAGDPAPPRTFTCEVERDFKGTWSPGLLSVSEADK